MNAPDLPKPLTRDIIWRKKKRWNAVKLFSLKKKNIKKSMKMRKILFITSNSAE